MTAPERSPRRWTRVAGQVVAVTGLAIGCLTAFAPTAVAQQGDFFDPFGIFKPLFQGPPREPRWQREPREFRERRPPRERPQTVDNSRAPPPRKSESTPAQTVVVMGANLADWLGYGLDEAFADRPEIGIVRDIRPYSGLIRYESRGTSDWAQVARDYLKDHKADVVVMLIGLMDRQSIREQDSGGEAGKGHDGNNASDPKRRMSGPLEFRSDEWAAAYSERIDRTIAALKSKGVPVIWVGLPSIRGTRSTSDMIYLNELFRARAERAGISYVDVWDGFVDDSGRYTNFGPDVEGQVRRLRTSEGVYFTKAGARKLAHYVEREIKHVIGTRLAPVAAVTPDDAGNITPHPGKPAARPLAGPVVPLNQTSDADELLGGGARPRQPDPLAASVLVKGDPLLPPSGRADNFFLTPQAAAAAAAATKEEAARNRPKATSVSAHRTGPATTVPAAKAAPRSSEPAAVAREEPAATGEGGRDKRETPSRKSESHVREQPSLAKRAPAPLGAHPAVSRPQPSNRTAAQNPRPRHRRKDRIPRRRVPPPPPPTPSTPAFDPFGLFR